MTPESNINMQEVFLNGITDGLIIIDDKGEVLFINHAALQMLSMTREDFVGRKLNDRLIIQTNQAQAAKLDDIIIKPTNKSHKPMTVGKTSSEGYFFVRSDRSLFPVSMTAIPTRLFSSEAGSTIIFYDLSADEKIEHAKSEFVSLVSHQLRTPVNIVSWYAEKLLSQKKGNLNEKQQDYLKEITMSNKRIVDLVQAIVNVSRTDLDRLRNKHEEVDVISLSKEALKQLEPIVKQKKLTIEEQYQSESLILEGSDREYVSVIINNIVANALKYTVEGGHVTVHVANIDAGDQFAAGNNKVAPKDGVLISVNDNGLGIPDDQKDQIFTKLFRADNVKALDVTGLGIGLYVAKSFVEQLSGQIWFKSRIREGSTFYIYIPY